MMAGPGITAPGERSARSYRSSPAFAGRGTARVRGGDSSGCQIPSTMLRVVPLPAVRGGTAVPLPHRLDDRGLDHHRRVGDEAEAGAVRLLEGRAHVVGQVDLERGVAAFVAQGRAADDLRRLDALRSRSAADASALELGQHRVRDPRRPGVRWRSSTMSARPMP